MDGIGMVSIGHRSSKSIFGAHNFIPLEFSLLTQKYQKLTTPNYWHQYLLKTPASVNTYISSDKRLDIRTMMEKHSCI